MNILRSLPWLLGPNSLCLSLVSQCSLGPNPCHGLQFLLLCRGGLLLRCVGLLLRHGGLLLRSGGLLYHRGELLLHSGGLLSCLLHPGGLLSCLLHPGGLLFCLLSPGCFLLCVGPVLISGSALAPSPVGLTLDSCSALVLCPVGSASVPSLTSIWTYALLDSVCRSKTHASSMSIC